jgi:hypothetical protein
MNKVTRIVVMQNQIFDFAVHVGGICSAATIFKRQNAFIVTVFVFYGTPICDIR